MTNRERLTEITERDSGIFIVLLKSGHGIVKLDLSPDGESTVNHVIFTDSPIIKYTLCPETAILDGPPQIEVGEPLLVYQGGDFVMLGTTRVTEAIVNPARTTIRAKTDAGHDIEFVDDGDRWVAEFYGRPVTEQEKVGPHTYRLLGIGRCQEGKPIELDLEGGAIRGVVQMLFRADGPDRSVLSPRFLRYFEGDD